jgi:copper(I)-binding protein
VEVLMNILQRGVLILAALVPAWAVATPPLEIADAWIPQAPPGASMFAGYVTLKNSGADSVRIESATSPAFGDVSIHETTLVDGVSRMRDLEHVDIAPGGQVRFEPGGRHLMLMQPKSAIEPGARIEVAFVLVDGRRVAATFVVRAADGERAVSQDHAHHP